MENKIELFLTYENARDIVLTQSGGLNFIFPLTESAEKEIQNLMMDSNEYDDARDIVLTQSVDLNFILPLTESAEKEIQNLIMDSNKKAYELGRKQFENKHFKNQKTK